VCLWTIFRITCWNSLSVVDTCLIGRKFLCNFGSFIFSRTVLYTRTSPSGKNYILQLATCSFFRFPLVADSSVFNITESDTDVSRIFLYRSEYCLRLSTGYIIAVSQKYNKKNLYFLYSFITTCFDRIW
jgi:hypothetical protein